MGRYLAIGLISDVSVSRDQAIKLLETEDAVRKCLKEKYDPKGLYDFRGDERSYTISIRRDLLRREWLDLLKTFYPMRYPDWKDETHIIDNLEKLNDPEKWLSQEATSRHHGKYAQLFYYDDARNDSWKPLLAQVDTICLSLDGRIAMECYDSIMGFFTRLVREKLSAFQLRDAISVYLAG